MWTHRLLFYSNGYNLLLSWFILRLRLGQIWPEWALPRWLLHPHAMSPSLRSISSLQGTKRYFKSHFTFSQAPALESAISPKEASPFYWRMVFIIWAPGAMSLLSGFLLHLAYFSSQDQGIHVYINIVYSLSLSFILSLEFTHFPPIPVQYLFSYS